MVQTSLQEQNLKQFEKKRLKESYDRLTAVSHIQLEHFSQHQKIEGFYEDQDYQHLFTCDRLLKVENIYGRLQMGYNPNRGRAFLLSNLKTSIYDTVASRYQKEIKEYQMKATLKGANPNRAYLSKRASGASVLLEKREAMPWTEQTVKPYFGRVNMEALRKTMPFFAAAEEREELHKVHQEQRGLQEQIGENSRKSEHAKNRELQDRSTELMQRDNYIQMLLSAKARGAKYFLRKMNYAFDIQKHEMFEYYKERREALTSEAVNEDANTEEDEED